jgi:hypothetical protein
MLARRIYYMDMYKDMARVMLGGSLNMAACDQERAVGAFWRKGDKHFFGFLWAVADEELNISSAHNLNAWCVPGLDAVWEGERNRASLLESEHQRGGTDV